MFKWCSILVIFSCALLSEHDFLVDARFVGKELTSGPFRFTDGRQSAVDSELAHLFATNPDKYWRELSDDLDGYVREKSDQAFAQWNRTVAQNDQLKGRVSSECLGVLEYMIKNPLEQEWSAKMIDSMASLPAGILAAHTITQLGDFDQCVAIDGEFARKQFTGKYCFATINLPREAYDDIVFNASSLKQSWMGKYVEQFHYLDNKYAVAMGVCFPSICHQHEIKDIMRSYYKVLQSFEFNVTYCQSRDEPPQYDPRLWIAATILAIPIGLVALAFVVDLALGSTLDNVEQVSTIRKLLHCFSPVANIRILFRITTNDGPANGATNEQQQFQFIHGIRALGSILVMVCHAIGLLDLIVLHILPYARYPTDFQIITRQLLYNASINGGLIVHLFFFVSGMLFTYHGLSPNKLKINFAPMVLLRWLRYTPAVVGMICMSICLELFGSGPLWHRDHLYINNGGCYDWWWTNILYIQNLVPADHQCSIHSWYIGAEMQVHILAFVLLLAYTRSSRLTYFVSFVFIGLQAVSTLLVVLSGWARVSSFHFYPFIQFPFNELLYNVRILYILPFDQFIPYFTGAIVGQLFYERKIKKFSKFTTGLCWTLSILHMIFMFTNTYFPMQAPNDQLYPYKPSTVTTALAVYVLTLGWSVSVAWVVYQCATSPSNPVARFLSAPIFQPLSRISFCVYLTHIMAVWFNTFQTRTAITIGNFTSMWKIVGIVVLVAYLLAFILYLILEAPSVNLIKIAFRKMSLESDKEKIDQRDVNANVESVTRKKDL